MQARYYAIALNQFLTEHPLTEVTAGIENLKQVLTRRGHSNLLPRVISELEKEMARDQKSKGVTLTLADEKDKVVALKEVANISDEKDIQVMIDPRLLGGYALRGPGFRFDNSTKTTLRELYKSLTTTK